MDTDTVFHIAELLIGVIRRPAVASHGIVLDVGSYALVLTLGEPPLGSSAKHGRSGQCQT
jgi:hypothetical protein